VQAIRLVFDMFDGLLKRSVELPLNCDETHISSRKKFKVLVPEGMRALKEHEDKLPHFSAMCTICANGTRLHPMIILPGCKRLPGNQAISKQDEDKRQNCGLPRR
jgi:hypothetical protein